ncbi:hypothetical protein [Amaricoccus macauensis]|uniref:hypothetical protein n=1 Tax=Amaricoccus macauensis TaxID=57001 RepID=UPI003C79AA80
MDGPAFPAPRAVSERLAARCPTLVLVVHGGPLEAKSALLAASLAQYYLPGRIVARVMEPEARWGALGPEARALFEGLGIPLVPAENRIDPDYPHGNKVAALEGISGPAVFLDSDMLLMCPFSWHPELGADIAAKPADIDTFSRGGGSWSRVWQLFNLETPAKSFTSTASREAMRPYFNAGFISVRDGDAFARMWVETVRRIDAEPRILNKRPWVDQIALPVTAARLGWEIRPLGDRFNFPCHLSDTGAASPYFAHYHWPKVIASQAPLLCRTRALLERVPGLAAILARHEEWDGVLRACDVQAA